MSPLPGSRPLRRAAGLRLVALGIAVAAGALLSWVAPFGRTLVPLLALLGALAVAWYAGRRLEALHRDAETTARESSFLAEASRALAESLDPEATLTTLARLAVPTLADACIVDVREPDGRLRRVAVAHHDPAVARFAEKLLDRYPPQPDGPHPLARVLRTGRPELYADIPAPLLEAVAHDDQHLGIIKQLGIRSAMVVPLAARGRILGAISFVSTTPARHFGPADLALAEGLAQRAAVAVDRAQLYAEAQAANRAKDTFLANLSHELRDPLHAIVGWTEILRARPRDADVAPRALGAIDRNARLASQLIADLLDVSRIERGAVTLDLRPTDLVDILEGAVDAARPAAESKGVGVTPHLPAGPVVVRGDAARLQQVVGNLLSNAVKFTDTGGWIDVQLLVEVRQVELHVIDSGRGIDPAFLPHVFDRFRQEGGRGGARDSGSGSRSSSRSSSSTAGRSPRSAPGSARAPSSSSRFRCFRDRVSSRSDGAVRELTRRTPHRSRDFAISAQNSQVALLDGVALPLR